jgi:virginiamycin B lyase
MIVTEYEVGPGADGVTLGADGAAWTSLTGRGELARVGPDGQVSHVSLDNAQSRPMVLARARITADGGITTFALPTAGAAPVGIDAGAEAVWVAEIGAGQVARLVPDGRIEEFPLPDRSSRPHAVAATPDGGCWATLWAASSAVRLDQHGSITQEIGFEPGAEPHGIALGLGRSVWIALEAGTLIHLTEPD